MSFFNLLWGGFLFLQSIVKVVLQLEGLKLTPVIVSNGWCLSSTLPGLVFMKDSKY